jgi:FKBP-type peptidyl-prolyl cis-trans isomerase (trigger factor)
MKRLSQVAAISLLSLSCSAQEVVDRMVAIVDKHVITQSDWDQQERFEALSEGRKYEPGKYSEAVLERLVDRALISESIARINFTHATREQVNMQIAEMRKQFPAAQSQTDHGWRKILGDYELSEEDLAQIVTEQLDVLRFVDVRFRPSVQIAPEEIERYYRETLLPELKKNNAALPPLKEVQERIRTLLTEQKVNGMLTSWLQSLRAQGSIQRISTTPIEAGQKPAVPR